MDPRVAAAAQAKAAQAAGPAKRSAEKRHVRPRDRKCEDKASERQRAVDAVCLPKSMVIDLSDSPPAAKGKAPRTSSYSSESESTFSSTGSNNPSHKRTNAKKASVAKAKPGSSAKPTPKSYYQSAPQAGSQLSAAQLRRQQERHAAMVAEMRENASKRLRVASYKLNPHNSTSHSRVIPTIPL